MLFCDPRLVWIPFVLFGSAVFTPGTTSLYFIIAAALSYGLLRAQFARWPWLLDDIADEFAFPYWLPDDEEA